MKKMKLPKGYKQPRYSVQLCWLSENNLISTLDMLNYCDTICNKSTVNLREMTLQRVEDIYNKRGGPKLSDTLKNPADIFEELDCEFKSFFKVPISKFFNQLLLSAGHKSFDIVMFDKWLQVPDGVSTAEFIEVRKGKKAVNLIKKIL